MAGRSRPQTLSQHPRTYGIDAIRDNFQMLRVHDFCDTASLVAVNRGVTILPTQYQLEPATGIDFAGNTVPYNQIRLLYSYWYMYLNQATAVITAKWGWTSVPYEVVEAVKLTGKDYITARGSKFGFVETSVGPVHGGKNWAAINLLAPWRRAEVLGI